MPQVEISRVEAAQILYKLFMLLYETPPIAVEIEDTFAEDSSLGIVAGGLGAMVLLGGGFYFVRKRKISSKEI